MLTVTWRLFLCISTLLILINPSIYIPYVIGGFCVLLIGVGSFLYAVPILGILLSVIRPQ